MLLRVGTLLGLWAMVVLYAWWVTPPDWFTTVILAVPMGLSVSSASATTFGYGVYRFYRVPLSDDWLRIPLTRVFVLVGMGILFALLVMWASPWLLPTPDVTSATPMNIGLEVGRYILGPTLVALPVGYIVGALVSPEAEEPPSLPTT